MVSKEPIFSLSYIQSTQQEASGVPLGSKVKTILFRLAQHFNQTGGEANQCIYTYKANPTYEDKASSVETEASKPEATSTLH